MRLLSGIAVGVLMILPAGLWAQSSSSHAVRPELDLAVTYSAQRDTTTSGGNFWMSGGSAELNATFYHGVGIKADVTGAHTGNISSSGVGLTLITATFGPTYTWTPPWHAASQRQWRFFGESLLGVANGMDSIFPDPAGGSSDAESMALQVGGGADLMLSRHFAVRLIQADWLRTQLPNGAANVQNNLQLGAGLVFRLP